MADNSMTFSNTLMQPSGEDFLRELNEFMLNRIMDACGGGSHFCTDGSDIKFSVKPCVAGNVGGLEILHSA